MNGNRLHCINKDCKYFEKRGLENLKWSSKLFFAFCSECEHELKEYKLNFNPNKYIKTK